MDETQWVLVPREPTPEMYKAAFDNLVPAFDAAAAYAAMIAAAPSPPAGGGEPVAKLAFMAGVRAKQDRPKSSANALWSRHLSGEGERIPVSSLDAAQQRIRELEAEVKHVQSDSAYVIGWNAGWDEAAEQTLRFPTMLRKMWSGAEVQRWIDQQMAELRSRARTALGGGHE